MIEEGAVWFCWSVGGRCVTGGGGSIGTVGWDWLCLRRGLIYQSTLRSRPRQLPCPGSTSKGATRLPNYGVTVVAPALEPALAVPVALPCPAFPAGDGWLLTPIVHRRHNDDCYRPDAAMTSDAGGRMGARPMVARAVLPIVSTAVDLFPTVSAFLLLISCRSLAGWTLPGNRGAGGSTATSAAEGPLVNRINQGASNAMRCLNVCFDSLAKGVQICPQFDTCVLGFFNPWYQWQRSEQTVTSTQCDETSF